MTSKTPEELIPVADFSKIKGIPAEKVIEMIGDGFYVGRKEADDCLAKEPTSTADCPGTAAVALRPPARIPRAGRKRMFSRHVSFVVSSALLAASGICTASPINGGFESPVVGGALPYLTISVGSEPAGFRWRVLNGTVDAVRQGPEFGATAYEGTQWLDLDGTSPGTLAQTFATVVGGQYTVNFAYANNPRSPGGATVPASGLFQVLDESTLADLILPFDLFHGSSTIADLAWTLSGDLVFTAHGASSTMRFQSLNPAGSSGGIFVDAVTVRGPANPIPVPTTPSLLVAALAAVALTRRSLAARQSGA